MNHSLYVFMKEEKVAVVIVDHFFFLVWRIPVLSTVMRLLIAQLPEHAFRVNAPSPPEHQCKAAWCSRR